MTLISSLKKQKPRKIYFQYLSSILPDINECSQEPCLGVENSTCENTEGSYKCKCIEGSRLSADGSTCEGKQKNSNRAFHYRLNAVLEGLRRET